MASSRDSTLYFGRGIRLPTPPALASASGEPPTAKPRRSWSFRLCINGGNSTAAGGLFNYGGTGSGYGVYSQANGHGNTGYAGYFINTDTSANQNWGIYASVNGSSQNSAAIQGSYSSNGNGVAVYGSTSSTGSAEGVRDQYGTAKHRLRRLFQQCQHRHCLRRHGTITGHGNTGFAGYSTNTSTTGKNYGVFGGIDSSASNAAAGYFLASSLTGDYLRHLR